MHQQLHIVNVMLVASETANGGGGRGLEGCDGRRRRVIHEKAEQSKNPNPSTRHAKQFNSSVSIEGRQQQSVNCPVSCTPQRSVSHLGTRGPLRARIALNEAGRERGGMGVRTPKTTHSGLSL